MIIADIPGWAWSHKADALVKYLSKDFDEIRKIYLKKFTRNYSEYKNKYNLFHFFGWGEGARFAGRATAGISSTNWKYKHLRRAKMVMPKYRALVPVSKLLAEGVKGKNKNIMIAQNGVDHTMFYPKRKQKKFIVGWMGQPTKPPHDQHGYTKTLKPLFLALSKLGISTAPFAATYKTAKPLSEMIDYYNSVSVMIHTGTMTGTPNPIFEAAACGRPVLSTRIGAAPELINGKNGQICNTIDDFVKEITFLRDNQDIAEQMGTQAREDILRDWTWEKRARAYIPIFKKFARKF